MAGPSPAAIPSVLRPIRCSLYEDEGDVRCFTLKRFFLPGSNCSLPERKVSKRDDGGAKIEKKALPGSCPESAQEVRAYC